MYSDVLFYLVVNHPRRLLKEMIEDLDRHNILDIDQIPMITHIQGDLAQGQGLARGGGRLTWTGITISSIATLQMTSKPISACSHIFSVASN